ncbi:LOW QUALITY PROTEIN: hypothetical protein ACHAWF_003133 [Thalassiosira exigua]
MLSVVGASASTKGRPSCNNNLDHSLDLDLDLDLPTFWDVDEASRILASVAHHTPIHTSHTLEKELVVRAFIKCENLQRLGSFKFRGGYNAVSRCNETASGILTYSSGNHSQAVAFSSKLYRIPATIIMTTDVPPLKLEATRSYATSSYDRYKEKRDDVARRVKEMLPGGTVFMMPHYDKDVITGQGTVGKEMIEDLQLESINLDCTFISVGGGGLISGISLAAKALSPKTKIIGVEPEMGNNAQQLLEKGFIVHIETPRTIADDVQTQHLGGMTFAIMKQHVSRVVTVTDAKLIDGMKLFYEKMEMIVEPTGCLGLMGLKKMMKSCEIPKGGCCGVVISGGMLI